MLIIFGGLPGVGKVERPSERTEVICSDPSEHRRRVETRNADLDGLSWPTWQAVLERTYEDWTRPHLVLDTAKKSIEEVTEELFNRLKKECKLKV